MRANLVELSFGSHFSRADVEIVRSILGRRWVRERHVWTLPHTPRTLERLKTAFGPRFARVDAPDSHAVAWRASGASTHSSRNSRGKPSGSEEPQPGRLRPDVPRARGIRRDEALEISARTRSACASA